MDIWARTGTMPPALENKPIIPPTLTGIVSAFSFLAAQRSYGMQANPITFEAKVAYANEYKIRNIDDRLRFFTLLMALDSAYLRESRDKAKRESTTT